MTAVPPAVPSGAPSAAAPAPRPLEVGRLLLAWLAAVVVVQGLGAVLSAALVSALTIERLWLVGLLGTVLGSVVGLVAAAVAVLVLAAGGRAAGRPAWHWVVTAVPPLALSAVLAMVVRVATLGGLHETPLTLGLLLVELAAAAGVAVGVGTLLRRSTERRAVQDAPVGRFVPYAQPGQGYPGPPPPPPPSSYPGAPVPGPPPGWTPPPGPPAAH